MPTEVTARVTALIPPFRIKIEEHQGGWDAAILKHGAPAPNNIGTFSSRSEAEAAAQLKVKEYLEKDGKTFPSEITWTTTKAVLPPEPPEQPIKVSLKTLTSQLLPIIFGIGAIGLVPVITLTSRMLTPVSQTQDAEIRKLSVALADTEQEIGGLKKALKDSQAKPNSSAEVIGLKSDVERLEAQFTGLENALGDNIDRRIAVPMMRKDLDAIKEQYKVDLAAVDARLSLVVDLMKWLVGIIGLGGILSGLSNWFARPKPAKESATSSTGVDLRT